MKVKIYKYLVKAHIDDDIVKFGDYFKCDFVKSIIPNGFDLQIDVETTKVSKDNSKSLFDECDGKYDVVFYMYDTALGGMPSFGLTVKHSKTLAVIYLKCDTHSDGVGYTWKSMCHEFMHAIPILLEAKIGKMIGDHMDLTPVNGKLIPYYKNEEPFAPDGNFAVSLKYFAPYYTVQAVKAVPSYKYFKMNESTGGGFTFADLKPELRSLLDIMRGECGFPFVINSGYRSKAHNASLSDAVGDSAHLSGLAVDISCSDSTKRYKLTQVAYSHGIKRLGEAKSFVHIDMSKTLPQNVKWRYD